MGLLQTVRGIFAPEQERAQEKAAPEIPVAVVPQVEDRGEYAKIAQQAGFIGYTEKLLPREKFRAFLAENWIAVYETRAVLNYLWRICPNGWHVAWIPIHSARGRVFSRWSGSEEFAEINHANDREFGPYEKPIPIVPLMTMAKIRETWPKAEFYVSDFVADRPLSGDPFMAVWIHEVFYVVERWDEPGFRQ